METLEARKEKYRQYLSQAEAFEDDEEMGKALKAYREALKYALHKKDAEQIQAKIIKLQDMMGYVSGMLNAETLSQDDSGGGGLKIVLIVAGVLLLLAALAGGAYFFLI